MEGSDAMAIQDRKPSKIPAGTILWVVGLVLFGSPARGEFVVFDPDGSGATKPVTIGAIDIAPGNALAVGAVPLASDTTFDLYFQARVRGVIDTSSNPMSLPGLNSKDPGGYQLTVLGRFSEVVTFLSPDHSVATFSPAPDQTNAFFNIYFNPAVTANDLEGTGFNQGQVILRAQAVTNLPSVGMFAVSKDVHGAVLPPTDFDQFVTNHYPGTSTVSGSGGSILGLNITSADPNFFLTPVSQVSSFGTSLATPFSQVSPSKRFTDQAGNSISPDIGTINGFTGPNFQFQADPEFAFIGPAAVPEPASIILAGLGFAGVVCLGAGMKRASASARRPSARLSVSSPEA